MSLSIGIVGLPNVGKSTLFNALTRSQQAAAENYPFCTIDANHAVVPLPDARLSDLQRWVDVPQAIPARVDFVDVAGLVQGASQGEGLGNRFLGHIRDVDAIAHVIRCFEDENVAHVSARLDPADDMAVINTELALADLAQVERRLEKLEREVKGDRALLPEMEMTRQAQAHLAAGNALRHFAERDHPAFRALDRELRLLTNKPLLYVANIAEAGLSDASEWLVAARDSAADDGADLIAVAAALEQELGLMDEADRAEYLRLYELSQSGLERLIRACYELLGLISFFTFNENETRAWTLRRGSTAPQAAGLIHTDFERGFIRAEVIPFAVFAEYQDRAAIRSAGLMQLEGRDYVVRDGDVILFRFNV